jgi:hypothetical protein
MRLLYRFQTKVRPFYIGEQGGRLHAIFNNENLGNYARPEQAADDLAEGHTISVFDTAKLNIPDELSQWERLA